MASNANWKVQIRNTWCEPHGPFYRPCTTGLAVYATSPASNATKSAILYDSIKDILTMATPEGPKVISQLGDTIQFNTNFKYNIRRRSTGGYTLQISNAGVPLTPTSTMYVTAVFTPTSSVVIVDTSNIGTLTSGFCIDPPAPVPDVVNRPMTVAPIVSATGSLFEQLFRSARSGIFPRHINPPTYYTSPIASSGAVAYCSSINLGTKGTWFYSTCVADVTSFGSSTIKEAQRIICGYQCPTTGVLSTLNKFVADPSICNTVCDPQAVNLRTNFPEGFNLHAVNWTGANLPAVVPTFTNSRDVANFLAPAGGEYTFVVNAQDCGDTTGSCCGCSGPSKNVTINVACQQKFWVHAGNTFSVNYDDFLYPEIYMAGSLIGADQVANSIHISWAFLSGPYQKYLMSAPTIYNAVSLNPYWIPYMAGTYVLELIAFDGCLFVKSTVTVNVVCYDTIYKPWYSTNAAPSNLLSATNEMVWADTQFMNIQFPSGEGNPFTPSNPFTYGPKPKSLTPTASVVTPFVWENSALDLTTGTWNLRVYYHNVISTGAYATTTNFSCTSQEDKDTPAYEYTREEADTVLQNYCRKFVTETGTETIVDDYNKVQCTYQFNTITLTAAPGTNFARISDLSQFENNTSWYNTLSSIVHQNDPFEFPVCTGTYNFAVDYKPNRAICSTLNETVPVDVKCRAIWSKPVARTLYPCFQVYFVYATPAFKQVTLNAADSNYYTNGNVKWTLLSVPLNNTWTVPNPNPFPATGTSVSFTPQREGVYSIKLSTTDNCAVDSEIINVTTVCQATLTGAMNSTFGSSMSYAYPSPQAVILNAGASSCSDKTATLYYKFLVTMPGGNISSASTNWSPSPVFPLTPNRVGTWSVLASITDGCKLVTQSWSTSLSCTNTLTAGITLSTTAVVTPTFNPSNPLVPVWPPVTVTDKSTIVGGNFEYRKVTTLKNGAFAAVENLPLTSGDAPVSFGISGPGTYQFISNIIDTCHQYPMSATNTLTTSCWSNSINPLIDFAPGFATTMYWEDLYPATGSPIKIMLFGNRTVESNTTYSMQYTWNSSSLLTLSTSQGGKVLQIAGASVGTWTVQLNVFDGCNLVSTTATFTILCRNVISATATTATPAVTWVNDKFPLVSVNGKTSNIGTLNGATQVAATWIFLHAPKNSIFKGRDDRWPETETIANQTVSSYALMPGKLYRYKMRNGTSITTIQHIRRGTTTLKYTSMDENFASCFRPDLPGTYTLQLSLKGPCTTSNATVTVTASCNAAPTISYTVKGESSDTPVVNKRIIFDASATTTPNAVATRFYWTITDCGINDFTRYVLNSASPIAYWTATKPGFYCAHLNVTDLCATSSIDYKFYVNCSMKYAAPTIGTTFASITPLSLQEVSIPLTDATVKRATYNDPFLWSYKWTLSKYTPPPTPAYSGVMTVLPTLALNVLALLAAMLFFF